MTAKNNLDSAKRIVIKVGSALLVDPDTGLRTQWLQSLVDDLAALQSAGKEIIVVSSGAIALGRQSLSISHDVAPSSIPLSTKQAAASVGQISLMRGYDDAFTKHNVQTAVILLTPKDTEVRQSHLNARATINKLLETGHVPIINENDTVATSEIRFGDNDRLAARVAQMIDADLVVQLSTTDGLYTANPDEDETAEHIDIVETINDDILAMAGDAKAGLSTGGMKSKLKAAQIATQAGIPMVITDGQDDNPIKALQNGARATLFKPSEKRLSARKKWISSHVAPEGSIILDDGAINALKSRKSLLPSGVIKVEGDFEYGDAVQIQSADNEVLAIALSRYHANEIRHIQGRKSNEIADILGYSRGDVVVHSDDLVLQD